MDKYTYEQINRTAWPIQYVQIEIKSSIKLKTSEDIRPSKILQLKFLVFVRNIQNSQENRLSFNSEKNLNNLKMMYLAEKFPRM